MKKLLSACLLLALAAPVVRAAPFDQMDYGPFISATYRLPWPGTNVAHRGVFVPFDVPIPGAKAPAKANRCGVIFDTETLRYAGYWNGGHITWNGVVFNGNHGANPGPAGALLVATASGPGWAKGDDLKDPRAIPHGPLPRDWARYKGLYRSEAGILFKYTVGSSDVLDMPTIEAHDKHRVFVRTLNLGPSKVARTLVVADLPGVKEMVNVRSMMLLKEGKKAVLARVVGGPKGTELLPGTRMLVKVPASDTPVQLRVCTWGGSTEAWESAAKALETVAGPIDLAPLTKGGKARFPETVTTRGVRSKDAKGAYVIDSLTPPFQNPYKSWLRFGGFDFFADGRAAVCTWSGDVWIVSGIDDSLEKLTWKRYAAGLFQALGLKIVGDKVHVLGRDQITRLHDLNGDGEADFYECFNNDVMITSNFHEFIFDLHADPEGNLYFVRGGPVRPGGSGWDKIVPHHGCLFKVSKDGSKLEVVARGFRAPNGMGVGPNGEITCGDNEGTWTPTCPINWIRKDGFYGVPEFAGKDPKKAVRDNPLCWLPHNGPGQVDNSNGGQVWVTGKNFGPLSGKLLHTSYGTSTLYEVLFEDVGGHKQGGVVPLLRFDSGVCRARFNEKQNALFLTGLRGWQTNAVKDAGFYRVRYTGQKAYLPVDLHARPGELRLTFSDPLDRSYAEDVDNYALKQWNYRWTVNYGSPHVKPSNPRQNGADDVEIESASLAPDGKTVTLKIKDLKPVMQMKIAYNLKAAGGAQVRGVIHNTINVVGELRGEIHPGEFRVVRGKK